MEAVAGIYNQRTNIIKKVLFAVKICSLSWANETYCIIASSGILRVNLNEFNCRLSPKSEHCLRSRRSAPSHLQWSQRVQTVADKTDKSSHPVPAGGQSSTLLITLHISLTFPTFIRMEYVSVSVSEWLEHGEVSLDSMSQRCCEYQLKKHTCSLRRRSWLPLPSLDALSLPSERSQCNFGQWNSLLFVHRHTSFEPLEVLWADEQLKGYSTLDWGTDHHRRHS